MTHYLINFSIYTMAMIGLIMFALFLYKKCTGNVFSRKSSSLDILDTMQLAPRKSLYVIKAENEKFLIASDVDRKSLIAKLDGNGVNNMFHSTTQKADLVSDTSKSEEIVYGQTIPFKTRNDKSSQLKSFDGIESINDFSISNPSVGKKEPVMRGLIRKLQIK